MDLPARRSFLKAGAAGVLGVASAAAWSPSASAAQPAPSASLALAATGVRRIDSRPRPLPGSVSPPQAAPATGDRCIVAGTLTSGNGDPGTFHADVVRLHDQGQMPGGGVACTLEQHLFTVPQGTLVGSGTSDADGSGTFAIVGGTGKYAT